MDNPLPEPEIAEASGAMTLTRNDVTRQLAELRSSNAQLQQELKTQKDIANALRAKATRLDATLAASRMGTWEWQIATGEVYWSPKVEHLHKLATGTFAGSFDEFNKLVHPDDCAHLLHSVQEALDKQIVDYSIEYRLAAAPQQWISARGQVHYGQDNEPVNMIGVAYDITERKHNEQTLRESQERICLLLDSTAEAIYGIDLEGRCTFCNRACAQLLGFKESDALLGKNMHELTHHTRRDGLPSADEECRIYSTFRHGCRVHSDDEVFWRTDGTCFDVEYWSYPIVREEQVIGAVVTFLDITENRRAQRRLHEAESELQHIMGAISDYLWSAEIAPSGLFSYRYYSPTVEKITGYPPEYFMAGPEQWLSTVHPDDRIRLQQVFQETLVNRPSQAEQEYRIQKPDGEIRWVRDSVTISQLDDGALRLQGIVSDISARKQAEQASQLARHELEHRVQERTLALRESEERFKAIVESTTDCILVWDRDYNYLYANQAAIDHVGTTRDKVIGKNIRDGLGHIPDFMQLWMSRVDHVFNTQQPSAVEDAITVGDQTVYSESRLSPIRDAQGRMFAVGVVYRDVTARKQAELELDRHRQNLQEMVRERTADLQREIAQHKVTEAALRRSEERYRAMLEMQTEYICQFKPDTTITFVNQAYCQGFGYQREQLIGHSFLELVPEHEHQKIREKLSAMAKSLQPMVYEHQVNDQDGNLRWQQWTDRPIANEAGQVLEFQSVGRDITERKLAEDRLKASLQEKEVLLREVHHRVKNNLQVITSLLDLQVANITDQAVTQLFLESQHRVRSMALIHERLYQSSDLASIDFADYLETLAHSLMESYSADAKGVSLRLDITHAMLTVETAIPCGLIINELVSNALKHAFPNDRSGQISVTLRRLANSELILQVADDGVGLPPTIDLENAQTLGLMIVQSLTQQLRGKLDICHSPGATLTLTFDPSPPKKVASP